MTISKNSIFSYIRYFSTCLPVTISEYLEGLEIYFSIRHFHISSTKGLNFFSRKCIPIKKNMQEQEKKRLCIFRWKETTHFLNRVIPIWNMLPSNVINFSSLNDFKAAKAALDKLTENGPSNT